LLLSGRNGLPLILTGAALNEENLACSCNNKRQNNVASAIHSHSHNCDRHRRAAHLRELGIHGNFEAVLRLLCQRQA
jgi:hypothetical protein